MKKTIQGMLLGCSTLLGTMLACLMPALAQAEQFDIVGLKPGMTEPEVIAAIKAHDPTMKITSFQSQYNYSDGVQSFQTAPFLSKIEASQTKYNPMETLYPAKIAIWFTPPPQGGRVWGIERKEYLSNKNPPTVSQYADALIKNTATLLSHHATTRLFPGTSPPESLTAFCKFLTGRVILLIAPVATMILDSCSTFGNRESSLRPRIFPSVLRGCTICSAPAETSSTAFRPSC